VDRALLTRLFVALQDHGVAYVLVGGLALNLHGITRATEDADLFIDSGEENVERFKRALHAVTGDDEVNALGATDLAGEYPVVRYISPDASMVLDVIGRLGERVAYADLEAQPLMFDGVQVRVATPATLVRMKRDTVRPVDKEDVLRLRLAFPHLEEG